MTADRLIPALLTLAIALAACDYAPSEEQAPPRVDPASSPPQAASTAPTPARLVPQELTAEDRREQPLGGELGCAFTPSPGGEVLLFAAADVLDDSRGEALVDLGEGPVLLTMDRAGGYNAMSEGARFVGPGGVIAHVVVTGDEPLSEEPRIAMESPRYPATLTIGRGGRTASIEGIYECGP